MTEEQRIFHRYIKSTGNRITSRRDAILRVLLEAEEHLTIEEIHERARADDPRISPATVYRTMKLLVHCGIARGEMFGDDRQHYECASRQKHHGHAACKACGQVSEFSKRAIESEIKRVARKLGFEAVVHSLKIYGLCKNCRNAAKAS